MYDFPVELQDAYTNTGKRINKKKAVVRTDNGEPLAIVSNRYCLISHKEVVDPMKEILGEIGQYKERVDLEKEGAVLHYTADFVNNKLALTVGDVCGLRVHIRNSYDGMGCTNVRIGVVVLSCTNGMVRDSNRFGNIRVRHVGNNNDRLLFPEASVITAEFKTAVERWDKFSSIKIDRKSYDGTILELSEEGVLSTKLYEEWTQKDHPETAWGLIQNVTYNLTHERDRMRYGKKLDFLSKISSIFERRFLS